jgi:hypothetical protein
MTEAHKKAYRHPKDKATSGMQNWRAHNKSLRDRGAIMLSLTTRPAMPGEKVSGTFAPHCRTLPVPLTLARRNP